MTEETMKKELNVAEVLDRVVFYCSNCGKHIITDPEKRDIRG